MLRWLHFILSHSIFISVCAVALCYQSFLLLNAAPDFAVFAFIFFSTLGSYNFYWLISKYSFARPVDIMLFLRSNYSYVTLFLLAGLGMLAGLMAMPHILPYVLIAIVLTLLYSLPLWPSRLSAALRRIGFIKTILLAITWAYVTTVIPAVAADVIIAWPLFLLLLARFCFMLLLCLVFDMRDIRIDKLHSLHSLATDVSKAALQRIMLLAFFMYLAAGFMLRYFYTDNYQLASFIITGAAVWIVYRFSLKQPGYVFYYFVVDGLMLFSALATYIAYQLRS